MSGPNDKIKCIKSMSKSKLIQMGFGDLHTCADEDESDFLSQSSISESDF